MLPSSYARGAGRQAGVVGMQVTERETIARPLAPPDVGSLSSEDDSDPEEEEEEEEQEEEEDDEEVVAEAVDNLLLDIEALRKSCSFPSLEELSTIDQKREVYLGPTMESNWVLPGRLLVGAYPASMNDSHHAHLLCTILLQGVTTFVCLQQEYRSEGVTEDMWRSGEALRPYYQDALQLLRKLRDIKAADPRGMPAICAPEDTDFVHFPIVDCNVADDTKVLHLAAKLAARIARGEVLYLHCWGGHGRTGTVVSIMLHLMYGLCADVAMERCQHVHDVRRIPISVGSPQTEAQREQVRRVVGQLVRRSRAIAAAAAATAAVVSAAAAAANVSVAADGANLHADVDGECASASATAGKLSPAAKSKSSCELAGVSAGVGGVQEGGGNRGGALSLSPEGRRNANGSLNGNVNGSGNGGGTGTGCGGRSVGGRRTWVRGRRQAFAQAPNGVGEPVSGWLHPAGDAGCGDDDEEEEGGRGRRQGEGEGGDFGKGNGLGLAEEGPAGEGEADCAGDDDGGGRVSRVRLSLPPSAPASPSAERGVSPEAAAAAGSEGRAPMPRRKSFTEPYSKEDPSRGTRMSRLRRKSAPGKPPADELAEGDTSPPGEGEGGEGGGAALAASTATAAAAAAMTAPDVLSSGGISGGSVPSGGGASCAADEPCAVAMSGCDGVGVEGRAHAPSCGVGGARCAR